MSRPGLQHERTTLAWHRTGLSFVVIAVLVTLHGRGLGGWAVVRVVSGVTLALVGAIVTVTRLRWDALARAGDDEQFHARPVGLAAAMSLSVIFCSVTVFVTVVM